MKRLLAVILCLTLLLGSVTVLAENAALNSVSGQRANISDAEAPNVIKVTFTENGKTLKPGDKIHVKVKLDDRSGITNAFAFFSGMTAGDGFQVDLAYDAASDSYTGEYTLLKSNMSDQYFLSSVNASDIYNNCIMMSTNEKNMGSFTLKNGAKDVTIKGSVKIKENGKSIKPNEEAHVTIKFDKPLPNADHIEMSFKLANGNGMGIGQYTYDKKSSTHFEGIITFSDTDRNDKYIMEYIMIYDADDAVIGSMKVTGQSITLTGASSDRQNPVISSVTLKEKGKKLTAGDTIHVSAKITDQSELAWASVSVISESAVYTDVVSKNHIGKFKPELSLDLQYNKSTGRYEGSLKLPKNLPDATYYLFIDAVDFCNNNTYKEYPSLCFTYTSPDYVDKGMKKFVTECFKATTGKKPTKDEVNEYGLPLATGKKKAVNVIKIILKKSKLTGEAAAEALWKIMQGKTPTDAEKAKTAAALKSGTEKAIDSLNNSVFRQRCKEWGITAGNFGNKEASTKVSSVDVSGGHYTLNGSKATFAGVTDKNVKSLAIQDTVTANGKTYKVTKIDGAACKGLKNLAGVTIGKNVTSIGESAFKDCKKLKTVTINAAKLKTVGKDAFSGIQKKAAFKCPKKQKDAYKKLIKPNAPKNAKFE